MMAAQQTSEPRLLDRLPAVRGRLTESARLSGITWFRVGGPAEVMFRPADRDDLLAFLAAKPGDVTVTVIGVASNLLVRDGGVPGVVVRLGRDFAAIEPDGNDLVCGAAAMDVNVARAARNAGIGGLRMNAGAYGKEFKDVVVWAEAADGAGHVQRIDAADMSFAYRRSGVADDWIFLAARLAGHGDDPDAIQTRMSDIQEARTGSQPIKSRTGGSTFKNPPAEESDGRKAWELIEAAGCRGLQMGGAQVSEQHCNFLINTGEATAADLEDLGDEVRRRVEAATGVRLEWEIRRIGVRGTSDAPAAPGGAS
jgi:UDP-N-acetylmuramate dehydrogenase